MLAIPLGMCACSESTSAPNGGNTLTQNALVFTDNSYLLTTTSNELFKVAASDGQIEFLGGFDNTEMLSPVDVVDGKAIISAIDNTLNAIDLTTGNFLWEVQLGATNRLNTPSAPVCSSTHCYVVGASKDLMAIYASDGGIAWSVSLDLSDVAWPATANRPLLVTEDLIFVGINYSDNSYRLNIYSRADGNMQESLEFRYDISGVPAVVDGYIVVGTLVDLYAFNQENFELLWQTDFRGASTPVIVGDTVVITGTPSAAQQENLPLTMVAGVSLQTGALKWTRDNEGFELFRPASDGESVFVISPSGSPLPGVSRGFPKALNPANGAVIWDLHERFARVENEPIAVPGHLFFNRYSEQGSGEGLASIETSTGRILWITEGAQSDSLIDAGLNPILVHEGQVYRENDFPTVAK